MFLHRGALYLIGTTKEYGDAVIRRSTDGGRTWTDPAMPTADLLLAGPYHCAPQPVVVHAGRIWRAMEDTKAGGGWGKHFRAFMMSAPEDADLLKAANWTFSNPLARDRVVAGRQVRRLAGGQRRGHARRGGSSTCCASIIPTAARPQ